MYDFEVIYGVTNQSIICTDFDTADYWYQKAQSAGVCCIVLRRKHNIFGKVVKYEAII